MCDKQTIYNQSPIICFAILAAILSWMLPVSSVRAQDTPGTATGAIRFFVDGEPWQPAREGWSGDPGSAEAAIESALELLRAQGYHLAKLDSVLSDSGSASAYFSRGKAATVRRVMIQGATANENASLSAALETAPGSLLDSAELQDDLGRILSFYAERGYQAASASISELNRLDSDSLLYDVVFGVDRGAPIRIQFLELPGAERTSARYAARAAGLRMGEVIMEADLDVFSSRLRDTGAFRRVDEPKLELIPDSFAVMVIPVEELPPGSFDLILGYLPAGSTSKKAQIVGSGHLNLQNPFGYGRTFGLKLDRRPGQVSSVDVRLRDPLLAGLPIRAEASFSGLQQDSTYNRRRWGMEIGHGLLPGVELAAHLSVELTRPGAAGLRLRDNRQRIPRSDARFWGLILRLRRLDRTVNPRSGVFLESLIENGYENERYKVVQVGGDTTRIAQTANQERLRISARGYLPVVSNQVIMAGGDVQVLLTDAVDESDLFRVGGATTLRGYDEDRFLASVALRFLFEYRLLLDSESNAFTFLDLGYIETPRIQNIPASRGWYPGFGIGMQLRTAAGIISVSYAMNDQDGVTSGRIHLGISFGL